MNVCPYNTGPEGKGVGKSVNTCPCNTDSRVGGGESFIVCLYNTGIRGRGWGEVLMFVLVTRGSVNLKWGRGEKHC